MGNDNTTSSRTAIVTASIALIGSLAAATFSAYTNIVVSNEKHSVERARLFKDLIEGLDSEEGSKSRLALLNLWQLYPDEHKVIVLASLEIGHSELVETMIRLDDEIRPFQDFLLVQAKSKDHDVAGSAKRIMEQLDPKEAAKIYVNELSAGPRVAIGDERIEKLIGLTNDYPDVRNVIESNIGEDNQASPALEYVLYAAVADTAWIDKEMTPARIDEMSDILCCGVFEAEDQARITETVLKSVKDYDEDDKYTVSYVATYLFNSSLQTNDLDANRSDVVKFARSVVENEDFYDHARANALRALAKWSPEDAFRLIVDRLADGEVNNFVKWEMTELLAEFSFISFVSEAINLDPSHLENMPTVDDDKTAWTKWRDEKLNERT